VDQIAFANACTKLGIDLNEAQLAAFEAFENDLYQWNEQKNLTRIPKEHCWITHFLDSLLVGAVVQRCKLPVQTILDIGTGPGFPAWPLACAFPNWQITAVDSNGKMLDFLKSQPLPNLQVHQVRIEEWSNTGSFDMVTGRALAPLPIQLEISVPFANRSGFVIPMRTPNDEFPGDSKLEKLCLEFVSLEREHLTSPTTEGEIERVFPIYRKNKPLPPGFRRNWAEIKKKPKI
jgi:16S rRNA (guanine527-N7)-methyltransferase